MRPRDVIAILVASLVAHNAESQQIAVKAGVTVTPDTVRIGDPFRVTVGIRAPRGATIEFPAVMDSSSTVQSLDPVVVRTSLDSTAVEQYGDYRLAAWDVGAQSIRIAEAVVRLNGVERRVPLNGNAVFVRTLLPTDSSKRVAKPPRKLFEFTAFPWWILGVIAGVLALGLLLRWWLGRRSHATTVGEDPYARAQSEFQRVESLGLLEAGERSRYVALMVEILRDYLAARFVVAALSLTSTELQRSLHAMAHVPQDRLIRLLTDADMIKFARRAVSVDRARELGREAQAIVEQEHGDASRTAPATGQVA